MVTGQGIEDLRARLEGKVALFSGHSGTGKSALVNAIEPSLQLRVGEISQQHHKGKHTTTFAEMFPFAGGYLMDTPGIKEFGLIRYAKEEVRDYFPEIREVQAQCKFNNCLHVQEPGCAVMQAVEEGRIPASRYLNYVSSNYPHAQSMDAPGAKAADDYCSIGDLQMDLSAAFAEISAVIGEPIRSAQVKDTVSEY